MPRKSARPASPLKNLALLFASALLLIAALRLWQDRPAPGEMPPLPIRSLQAAQIVAGAREQIGDVYDARYQTIKYPGGDVELGRGACTDVVVRALRQAGIDLQESMHRDMRANFSIYPKSWGLSAPNYHIDHRRVPNQMAFFKRHAKALPTVVSARTLHQWQPGDIVYWNTAGALRQRLHTGVVTNRRNGNGVPLVVHNGWRCIEDDALTRWKIIGHFRLPEKTMS